MKKNSRNVPQHFENFSHFKFVKVSKKNLKLLQSFVKFSLAIMK